MMFGESEEARLKQMLQDAYNDVPFIEHDEGLLLRNLKKLYQRPKVLLQKLFS